MTQNKPLKIIGVTGISGSGTSTVAEILRQQGGFIVQADKLAHEVMKNKSSVFDETAFAQIIKSFGEKIISENGEINRRILGEMVFGKDNMEKLSMLEKIIHPPVVNKIFALIEEATQTGLYKFAVIDAPLLVESGLNKECDQCWLITAPEEVKIKRIITRDNISEEAAEKRLNSRNGDEALKPFADKIIENNGNLKTLEQKIISFLEGLS